MILDIFELHGNIYVNNDMRLSEILREAQQEFYVYKATGAHTPYVYYGYSQVADVAKVFFGAGDEEVGRGSSQLIRANKWDKESIKVEMIDIFDNQYEAWVARNDLRAQDSKSIVGPSHLPTAYMSHAVKTIPEKVKQWKVNVADLKTARDAFSAGRWAKDVIQNLAKKFKREQVINDLDTLSPEEFAGKYRV